MGRNEVQVYTNTIHQYYNILYGMVYDNQFSTAIYHDGIEWNIKTTYIYRYIDNPPTLGFLEHVLAVGPITEAAHLIPPNSLH